MTPSRGPRLEVLVIGGTRFAGYALACRLIEDGHRVTIFSRGRSPRFPAGATAMRGDRSDHAAFRRAFDGRRFDAVIDFVAFDAPDSEAAIDAFAGRIGHFVHISTGSVYMVLEHMPCPLVEEHYDGALTTPPEPSPGHAYGMGKRRAEEALWRAHRDRGFPVTALRLPIILGELDPTRRMAAYCHRILDGGPLVLPGGGANRMTFVHRDDVGAFVAANLLNPRLIGEPFNLAQDETPTVREVVMEAARILGRSPAIAGVPFDRLGDLEFDFAASPFSTETPFVLSNAKAKRLGGFAPRPMVEWLPSVVADAAAGEPPANMSGRAREREIAGVWGRGVVAAEGFEPPTRGL